MDRPADHGGVIFERTDDRMLVEERQRLLLGRAAVEDLADGAQQITAVRKGRFAGFFQ
jgi:hypothetical protein